MNPSGKFRLAAEMGFWLLGSEIGLQAINPEQRRIVQKRIFCVDIGVDISKPTIEIETIEFFKYLTPFLRSSTFYQIGEMREKSGYSPSGAILRTRPSRDSDTGI